ncbi:MULTISPECIES: DEAD/DEAH box helicase family protein [Acidovorax]|uniref:DEAD/DEAH box helicase family protein n=1 Tax=Acidovorax facilis TaxID=12917 RepID=A0ABV8D4P4_9BURK|nr:MULTISPECIES: DEAD/DEAH box helicase family protein [Acidovorax]KQB56012.1 restriction endonuclease subunit R [Acidovorax sp. SD340]MBO1006328.1 DEAD/DEAH box helicase family protein [Acidovorax sp. SD340]MCO4240652.1 DEAD/DEAH box helicase family protein [Acidovorax facilis]
MSNFAFLQSEWSLLFEAASKAEGMANTDARASCFYARRTLELAVDWLYKHDKAFRLPYQDQLSALIHEPSFRQVVGDALFTKARLIKDLGNLAVHSTRKVAPSDALVATRELFHFCYWLARTYGQLARPDPSLQFSAALLPKATAAQPQSLDQLQKLETQLHERDEKLSTLLSSQAVLNAELQALREQVAAAKKANTAQPDTHDYSEAETRDYFIDLLLKEAGWELDQKNFEIEVSGMPNNAGQGFVDYVLWGDDGLPLALVEAKRTKKDAKVGQQQAKLYADCLEAQYGQRPVIFYSNGYQHWLWDDARYAPRAVQGFFKKPELELMVQRRASRKKLADAVVNGDIIERYYQTRAVRRIGETFEVDNQRKALVVMATGAGKTRTVIALADVLMRCNWAKRVLFLADRVALVNQAVNAFKTHLPDSSPVNLVTEKYTEGRVFVSTYPTMMGLIDDAFDGQRRFGVGHFDLIIIDEAHRSVYQKYRAIFEYFDALLVGLTATPKDEIDHNTYGLFDLESGVPTDAYGLDEAVADGYLVPPKAVSVPLKFQREGIKYDDLSEAEQEQWDALEWNEDGTAPDAVDATALNKWLFNTDTVDKVLAHLMTKGQKVAGGDRLGKTIVFAKNNEHAEFIADRFNVNYPHYKGHFARVVTYKTEYAQSLIDDFSAKDKAPHIALSVDMLDTGIDVPEVVNLVFFKVVRSKTKFWQMLGRGTRLCRDLFAPGEDKQFFYLFDYCQNLEFFSQNPDHVDGAGGEALGTRLFKARLQLVAELDHRVAAGFVVAEPPPPFGAPYDDAQLRSDVAGFLHQQVAAMNMDNFVVRPQRRLVEKYAKPQAWKTLGPDDFAELADGVADLPTEFVDDDEEAKRFDLLVLRTQLAILQALPGFDGLKEKIQSIASALEEQDAIPAIKAQMVLIQSLVGEEWWEDVTVAMLETARKRLRALVKLIEKGKKKVVYTDFEDELGDETAIELPQVGTGMNLAKFRDKARQFLKAHASHVSLQRLRRNQPLTPTDLTELERMLVQAGGSPEVIEQAKAQSHGLGIFIRSLVGLDSETARQAFSQFVAGTTATASQIEFIDLVVQYLTENGVMEPARLYESPFIDINDKGPEAIFLPARVDEMVRVLEGIRERAVA